MRTNWITKIIGDRIILVPYHQNHVDKYHQWMKSQELQELTGSEPLTLDEEYEMQLSWRDDEDKCTFIILDKERVNEGLSEVECMVGDTNLFIQQDDDVKTAEAEIMIAESSARGKGFGEQALSLMLLYGIKNLSVIKFIAKIKFGNIVSEKLFKKLGFSEESRSEVFGETTFSWMPENNSNSSLIYQQKFEIQHFQNTQN